MRLFAGKNRVGLALITATLITLMGGHYVAMGEQATGTAASPPLMSGHSVLPRPEEPFGGEIGRTAKGSRAAFPTEVRAPKGAPNVLLIMTDDVGFGASSPYGGPIPTTTFDRLAASGLRYTQFHTTALCSPTRAALISGRNHHTAATGVIMELGTGYPGYHSLMPRDCGTFAEVLKQSGWSTAWYGKNHNVPDWHNSQAGPFDLWPTGLGFEYRPHQGQRRPPHAAPSCHRHRADHSRSLRRAGACRAERHSAAAHRGHEHDVYLR
jgi:arylsulfatase A-like enzyme